MTERIDSIMLARLARGLVVREVEVQDTDRNHGRRVKLYTEAVAKRDGFADAVYRVVDGYGPQQVLFMVRDQVGVVPAFTSAGRQAWLAERTEAVAAGLRAIELST